MQLLHIIKFKFILFAGSFQPLVNLFNPFISGAKDFLQLMSTGIITIMAIYYKLREATASVQEDQMFSKKAISVLTILAFIFIIPTIVSVLESYFG